MAQKPKFAKGRGIPSSGLAARWGQLRDDIRAATASGRDRTAIAELIIDEMARRQGHRFGPYFEWALATDRFQSAFDAALALRPQDQTIAEFVRAFVDAWPEGQTALRVIPDVRDPIANPPYTKDGFWPAFLKPRR